MVAMMGAPVAWAIAMQNADYLSYWAIDLQIAVHAQEVASMVVEEPASR